MITVNEKIKCQSCIERQFEPIGEAIGLWQNLPICENCLKPLLENFNNIPESSSVKENQNEDIPKAEQFVEALENLFNEFPMRAEKVLQHHDDFYNHRALANINLPVEVLEKIIDYRKAIIFVLNRRNEPDVVRLQELKREERRKAGIALGDGQSIIEKAKTPKRSSIAETQERKLAKALGISIEQLREQGKIARQGEFRGLLGGEAQTKEETKAVSEKVSTRAVLAELKAKTETKPKLVTSKAAGTRCAKCGKFTCLC